MDHDEFVKKNIDEMGNNLDFKSLTSEWMTYSAKLNYSYNFSWFGRPIIQYPQDLMALQEIVWKVKPDLIIETGIAHGGSLIFSASLLALLDICDNNVTGSDWLLAKSSRKVLGIDIDIRPQNKKAIEGHPLSKSIMMIEGSSTDTNIFQQVSKVAENFKKILVVLDSNHTHSHVLQELQLYSKLVSRGSYCIVFDTIIEDLPPNLFENRDWSVGNSPKTAVREFLSNNKEFQIDGTIENKLSITVAPSGYLIKIS